MALRDGGERSRSAEDVRHPPHVLLSDRAWVVHFDDRRSHSAVDDRRWRPPVAVDGRSCRCHDQRGVADEWVYRQASPDVGPLDAGRGIGRDRRPAQGVRVAPTAADVRSLMGVGRTA